MRGKREAAPLFTAIVVKIDGNRECKRRRRSAPLKEGRREGEKMSRLSLPHLLFHSRIDRGDNEGRTERYTYVLYYKEEQGSFLYGSSLILSVERMGEESRERIFACFVC